MLLFVFSLCFAMFFAILTIVFLVSSIRNDKKKVKEIMGSICTAIVTVFLLIITPVPMPDIFPVNNQFEIHKDDVEIIIEPGVNKLFKIYYTLDGTDPKNKDNTYTKPFVVSKSTTVCARTKFLFMWSDPTESTYIFDDSKEKLLAKSQERPSYSLQEISQGTLGDTITFNSIDIIQSDHEWYQQMHDGNYIPYNTVLNEFSFVGIRKSEINYQNQSSLKNEIFVEDGGVYTVNLYVNNDNPSCIAEDTKVWFDIPTQSSEELKINGYIESSNASPSIYSDYVILNSKMPFHIEYQYGSAMLKSDGIFGVDAALRNTTKLSDNIIQSVDAFEGKEDGGVLIGYNALDGKIPGGYEHICNVSIVIKTYYDYDFDLQTKVRFADSEDSDSVDFIDAKVGDRLEFITRYINTGSNQYQPEVKINNILDENLRYIPGTATIVGENYPDAYAIDYGDLTTEGLEIGDYRHGEKAFIVFTAEVVDTNLSDGENYLTNRSTVSIGTKVVQDYAKVRVIK